MDIVQGTRTSTIEHRVTIPEAVNKFVTFSNLEVLGNISLPSSAEGHLEVIKILRTRKRASIA
ncbi:MAG: hypothetical protein DRO13_01200 [Thermoprotei archaeon]|nr:MAG: hypothetical protein DRO13_01200 [Thermoprotei archaeon]